MGIEKPGRQIFRGISVRLIVSFSLILILMVFITEWVHMKGAPFSSYKGVIEKQKEETFNRLARVADREKDELLRWMNERRGNTLVTARNANLSSVAVHLRQRVSEFVEDGTNEPELWSLLSQDETYLNLTDCLRTIRDSYGYYDNIQIADAKTGIVFVSTDNSTLGTDLSNEPYFINALLTRMVYIDDITIQLKDRQPAMHFSHLVSDGQGNTVAVLIMKVKTEVIMKEVIMNSVLQSDSFLGESG